MSETKIQKSSFCTFISVYTKLIPPMFKSWKKISKRDTKQIMEDSLLGITLEIFQNLMTSFV